MYQPRTDTRHLPPELQELVDTIINGVVTLASRVNSNSDSNSLGGTSYLAKGVQQAHPEFRPTIGIVVPRSTKSHAVTQERRAFKRSQ